MTAAFLVLFLASAGAQNLNSIDFQNLRSSDLSDQQVRQLWERVQSEGYTISQMEQLALARGMRPAEVSKLMTRLRDLRMGTGQQQAQQPDLQQLRSVNYPDTVATRDTVAQEPKSDIFGANLFRSDKISFTPPLNIPTPEDYQLGPGDELVIDIWGAAEQTYRLTVSPEGTISIANLGPIYVNGLTMARARDRLRNSLGRIYSGLNAEDDAPTDINARISLGNIRSINVTVLGEARTPGTYTVPSLATVFNVLYTSGGPDSTGTFREIEIIRGDSVAAILDIYDFLVNGDQSDNIRLRDQDIVKIDPYIRRVRLMGRTKRTGRFELKEGETLGDLIAFAGGFSEDAYTRQIKVVSNTESRRRIDDIDYPEQRDFVLPSGSEVTVGKVLDRYENRVEIRGAVFRPGYFELNDTASVSSLIQRAEGVTEDAFMNRGLIYREQPDLTMEAIPFSVRNVLNDPENHDIPLQKNDIVRISSIFDLRENYTIEVKGAVLNPGTFMFVENMTLEDVVFQAGGLKESAAPYRIEVSRRIEESDSAFVPREIAHIFQFRINQDLELDPEASRFTLKPFDKIFVRMSPAYVEQQQVTIQGEVLFPGDYTLDQRYMRISDLIRRAGGLTEYAYPQGANLTRRVERQVDTTTINLGDTLSAPRELGRTETKVGIKLNDILQNPGSESDLILREGDVLDIPKELQTVRITGEVLYPVSVRFERSISFKEYLRAAGGATEMGRPKDAYIVYANGEVDRANKFLFFRDYPRVRPGATIYVPRKEPREGLSPQERIGIISAIVSMAAIVSNTIFQIRRN